MTGGTWPKAARGCALALAVGTLLLVGKRILGGPPPGGVTWTLAGLLWGGSLVLYLLAPRCPRPLLRGLCCSIASVLVTLAAGEGMLAAWFPVVERRDTWKEEFWSRRDAGQIVYPLFRLEQGLPSSEGKPFLSLSGPGGVWTYGIPGGATRSDAYGFNNPAGYYDRHPSFDLFALGDSFVHGGQIVERLRQVLGRSVYNAGYSGNGPLAELATLVEYGHPKRPAVVLWFFYEGNDLSDGVTEARIRPLRRYLSAPEPVGLVGMNDQRQRVVTTHQDSQIQKASRARQQNLSRQIARWWSRFPESTQLVQRFRQIPLRRLPGSTLATLPRGSLPLFSRVMRAASETTRSSGGQLVFVYLPEYRRVLHPQQYADEVRLRVLGIVRRLGIPTLDLTDRFLATPAAGERLFVQDAVETGGVKHYNDTGYRRVAEAVADFLEQTAVREGEPLLRSP